MHISVLFLHIYSILLHVPAARFLCPQQHPRSTSTPNPRSTSSLACQWQPRLPSLLNPSWSNCEPHQHPWHSHAASTVETVERHYLHVYPAHANKIVRNNKLQKLDSKQSTNRAACTMVYWTNRHSVTRWALLMTSPMDTQKGHQCHQIGRRYDNK